MKVMVGYRNLFLSFFDLGAKWVGWWSSHPGSFAPGNETLHPFYRSLDERGKCHHTGVKTRVIQPIASLFTDYSISGPLTALLVSVKIFISSTFKFTTLIRAASICMEINMVSYVNIGICSFL
jgi:hypothetical protein